MHVGKGVRTTLRKNVISSPVCGTQFKYNVYKRMVFWSRIKASWNLKWKITVKLFTFILYVCIMYIAMGKAGN